MSSGTGMANYAKLRIGEGAKSILPGLAGGAERITAKHIALAVKRAIPWRQRLWTGPLRALRGRFTTSIS